MFGCAAPLGLHRVVLNHKPFRGNAAGAVEHVGSNYVSPPRTKEMSSFKTAFDTYATLMVVCESDFSRLGPSVTGPLQNWGGLVLLTLLLRGECSSRRLWKCVLCDSAEAARCCCLDESPTQGNINKAGATRLLIVQRFIHLSCTAAPPIRSSHNSYITELWTSK